MKKLLTIITCMAVGIFIFTGCEDNEHYIPTDTPSVFYFNASGYSISEDPANAKTLTVTVTWSKHIKESANITFEVIPTGKVPAVEGVDYTISTKSLTFGEDDYTQSFTIKPIYNDTYTGTRTFNLKITSTTAANARISDVYGAPTTALVSISDIDHPLSSLFGAVDLNYTPYFAHPTTTTSVIEPDEEDVTIIHMGFNQAVMRGGPEDPILAKMIVTTTDDEFILSCALPYESGLASGGNPLVYVATAYIEEMDDWDVLLDGTTPIPYTIVGRSPKDNIKIEWEATPSMQVQGATSFMYIAVPPPDGTFIITKR